LRNEYIRRSLRYSSAVRELYDQALKEISMEFSMLDYDPNLVFSFEKFGKFSDVDRIMTRLEQQIQQTINLAIENEFGAAYKAHESLLKQVLGSNVKKEVWQAFAPRISSGNAALLYMTETASDNITHSTRVWNGAVLGQMETAVQQAMMEGMPAKQMAGLIEQYLNDPDSCFRRFRIKTGVDADGRTMYGRKWKKRVRNKDGSTSWFDADPRDYPTGQGVYHSSYKNALRYTRTSTNIAYRTADLQRYQTELFVLGFEIRTTSNPAHKEDICDLLAGRYPKEFKWVGWHPQCMCFQVPILATPEEVDAMADAIIKGQDPASVPVAGRVTDVPDNYKEWVAKNEDRIQQSIDQGRQLPYFLRDNGSVVDGKYEMNVFGQPAPSTIDMARQRHQGRTNEMVADILSRNEERHERLLIYERLTKRSSNILKIANEYTEVDASKLNGLIKAVTSKPYYVPSEMDKLRSSLEDVKKAILQQKQLERKLSDVIPDVHEWHKRFIIAELQSTKKAVEKRIADYERDYKGYRTLKDKMEFEANWVRDHKKYSTWEVAESAYRKKAIFYEENAAWSNIDGMISDAESYGHVSSIYDSLVSKAKSLRIASGDKAYIESTLHGAELLREKYKDFDKRLAILKGFKTKSSDFKQLLNTAETFRSSDAPTQVIEEAIVEAEQRMASIMNRRGGSVSLGSFGKVTLDDIKKKMGTNFPRTLEHLDDAIKKFTRTNPDFEPSRDEIEKVLFDLFKDNDFGMDIDSDVLESVYKNGFYNQFQSGTSNGSLYEPGKTTGKISTSNSRLIAAHKMFGLGDLLSNQLERHEYEKYGHLLDHNMLNAIKHNLTWYGNTQVRFKKDRVVCTWTFDDSLGLDYQPSLTSDPKIESLDFILTEYKPKASDPKKLFQWQNEKLTQYVELQYHGNLTIDDVESMVFKSRPDNLITLDLIKRLIGKGIKLFYYERGAVVEYIL